MQMSADVQSSTKERNAHYKVQGFNLKLMVLLRHHCPYNIYNIHCHHDITVFQMVLINYVNKLYPIEERA